MAALDPAVVLILDEPAAREHVVALRNEAHSYRAMNDQAAAARYTAHADRLERQLTVSTSKPSGARR